MNNLITNITLENIDLESNKDLLQIINKINDNVKVHLVLPIDSIIDMFNYYVKSTAEHIKDIEEYDCIAPEIIDQYGDGHYFFNLNSINDDESQSDIEFIQNELKRQFGVNFKNAFDINELFRVLLMDCSDYDIINDMLNIKLYYKNYMNSWIKLYLEENNLV